MLTCRGFTDLRHMLTECPGIRDCGAEGDGLGHSDWFCSVPAVLRVLHGVPGSMNFQAVPEIGGGPVLCEKLLEIGAHLRVIDSQDDHFVVAEKVFMHCL